MFSSRRCEKKKGLRVKDGVKMRVVVIKSKSGK